MNPGFYWVKDKTCGHGDPEDACTLYPDGGCKYQPEWTIGQISSFDNGWVDLIGSDRGVKEQDVIFGPEVERYEG